MQQSAENIDVVAEMKIDNGVLYFDYSVKNKSPAPLFLFNILHGAPGSDGLVEVDEGSYVELGETEVVISKKQLSLPFGVLLLQKTVPFVTRIPSQRSFRENFQMPLPLSRKVYYEEQKIDENAKLEPTTSLPLSFELGYFFGKPGTDELAKTYKTNKGDVIGFDPFPIGSQKVLSIGPFANVPTQRS